MKIDFYKQLNDLKEIPGYKSFNLEKKWRGILNIPLLLLCVYMI